MTDLLGPAEGHRPTLAYLVSEYPAVSHTFVQREVAAMRARGWPVRTFSIRRTRADQLLTDRADAETTYALVPARRADLVRAHLAAARRPRQTARTWRLAMQLSTGGWRSLALHAAYAGEAILLWHRLRLENIGHVHVHLAMNAATVALLAAEQGTADGLTWSFAMHGPTEFDDVGRFRLREKVQRAAFVACIGDYCRSQLMKLVEPPLWSKLVIVECGVDERWLQHRANTDRAPGPLRILCVGRLVPDKGQTILLDAVAALRKRGFATEVRFVGAGRDRDRLRRHARRLHLERQVTVLGSVGQDVLPAQHHWADVMCLPSFAEGKPVALMEAMAGSLPVVSTRIAGIPELVDDEVSGLLVAPGSVVELVDALERLTDAGLRRRLGAAGRATVAAHHDARTVVEPLEATLLTVVR